MPPKSSSFRVLALILVIAGGAGAIRSHQNSGSKSLLNYPVDEHTAVRFFYNLGADKSRDYFHGPLTFRAVTETDSRINTRSLVLHQGRTVYISLGEMRNLVDGLARFDVPWESSRELESLDWSIKPLPDTGKMDILAVFSKGTARAKLDPQKICTALNRLDSALKTPRALWEFQRFRLNYGCQVPGFDTGAYPDH
ncbi:MAG TPA: hypothetical protein VGR84_14505 [Candidatus Acidoferrales bacterium]|nr:hypothetical protein [Candidatus Acidoferrales bacterium]